MPLQRARSCPNFTILNKSYASKNTQIFSKNTLWKDLFFPTLIGCAIGLKFWVLDRNFGTPISINSRFTIPPYFVFSRSAEIQKNLVFTMFCLGIPLQAATIYWVLIQRSVQWTASHLLGDKKFTIRQRSIRIASLVSAVVSGMCFGLQFYKMTKTIDIVKAVSFGIILGLLNEQDGLLAPITAFSVYQALFMRSFPILEAR